MGENGEKVLGNICPKFVANIFFSSLYKSVREDKAQTSSILLKSHDDLIAQYHLTKDILVYNRRQVAEATAPGRSNW